MTDRPMHPATAEILRFFAYDHLPPHLQTVSAPVGELAIRMAAELDGPELTAGLRKLLEAKDCFVRAAVEQRRAAEEAAPQCGRCRQPFSEGPKAQWHDSGFCWACIDNCHEGGADHRCVICVPKESGR